MVYTEEADLGDIQAAGRDRWHDSGQDDHHDDESVGRSIRRSVRHQPMFRSNHHCDGNHRIKYRSSETSSHGYRGIGGIEGIGGIGGIGGMLHPASVWTLV